MKNLIEGKLYKSVKTFPVWFDFPSGAAEWLPAGQILLYIEFRYISGHNIQAFLWNDQIVYMFESDTDRIKRIHNDAK